MKLPDRNAENRRRTVQTKPFRASCTQPTLGMEMGLGKELAMGKEMDMDMAKDKVEGKVEVKEKDQPQFALTSGPQRSMGQDAPPLLWDLKEAARQLGEISVRTVRRMLDRGELPKVRVGKSIKIPAASIHNWVAQQASLAHNTYCVGSGVRQQEVNVCHINAKTAASGGRTSPTQAAKELDALLEPRTARRRRP